VKQRTSRAVWATPGTVARVGVMGAVVVVASTAWAGPRAKALKAIEAEDYRGAKKALQDLDDYLGSAKTEILPRAVGLRYQTEALYHHKRGKESDTLKALRQACLVHPAGKPNPDILGAGALVDMYYAVCSEVQQRPEVDLAALNLPDAPLRVDGVVPGDEFPVRTGRHLVQVQCADESWSSQWSELTAAADWGAGCEGGAFAAAEAPASDDPMDMVPFFGGDEGDDGGTTMSEEPVAEEPVEEPPEAVPPPAPEAAAPPAPEVEPPAPEVEASAAPADGSAYALQVSCAPDPCSVQIDGEDRGSTTLEVELAAGMYDLTLVAGKKKIERKVSLSADHPTTIVSWNHRKDDWEMKQPRAD